jgi:acyl-CoA synthetase (NDP forming)
MLLLFEMRERLRMLFHPRSIAFIGASNRPGKWGFIILANLINGGFKGAIYPINPSESQVQGLQAYRKIGDLPEVPDLAVIVVPPPVVPPVIGECVDKGIRAGVVITAGFGEVGSAGERLQREMLERARAGGMILVGPNCNGIMSPPWGLYVAMPPVFPLPGPMAVVAQSGNVATSIARRGMKKGFGISRFVSSGNEADLHCEDYFEYLSEDPETRVILSYIEGFRDGRRFFSIAKEVSRKKPIIMLKAGATGAGAKAAMSHTAAMAGSDAAFEGAYRQAGIIRAMNIDQLANMAAGFVRQPLPSGRRVGIVTAGGGWGVLAADACAEAGLEVPALPGVTIEELDRFLPAWWSRSNPVDLVAGLRPDHLGRSLECLLRCPTLDGIILLGIMPALPLEPLPPSAGPEVVEERLEAVLEATRGVFNEFMGLADHYQKPVVIASEFPVSVENLENRMALMLGQMGHVCYPSPEDAAMTMAGLARYAEYLRSSS